MRAEVRYNKMNDVVLVGDIGGTNARFGLGSAGAINSIGVRRIAEFRNPYHAIRSYLESRHVSGEALAGIALGVAGPIVENSCRITNTNWFVEQVKVKEEFGCPFVCLLNDFEALAWSLSTPSSLDLLEVGKGNAKGGVKLVLGPGTGFGVACFLTGFASNPMVLSSEAGHCTISGLNHEEDAVIEQLRNRFGHVSIERALSGAGLENIYWALSDKREIALSAADITAQALQNKHCLSRRAFEMFCALLGTTAGNLALTFGARGGVFIGGGIVPRFAP